jgi:hypothetical protein
MALFVDTNVEMGCTNSIVSRLWTGWLRSLGSIPERGRRFLFYKVSGLTFVPTLPPSEYVPGALPLGVKWQTSEADSPHLYNTKEEFMKLYPLLTHMPWCCAQGWPNFIQGWYKLSEYFAKPYFHKYWTEIHDVTTIWKRNVCSFIVTLNAFDVRPTCDTADVQAILPFPPNTPTMLGQWGSHFPPTLVYAFPMRWQ